MIWHRRTLLSLREPSLCSSYRHTLITSAASYCASATDWCKAWSLCSTTAARWSTPDPSLRHAAHFHSAALRSGLSHAGHSAARDNPVTVSNAANTLTHPTGVGRLQPWLRRRGSTPRWVTFGERGQQRVPPPPDHRRRPLRAFSVQSGGDGRMVPGSGHSSGPWAPSRVCRVINCVRVVSRRLSWLYAC